MRKGCYRMVAAMPEFDDAVWLLRQHTVNGRVNRDTAMRDFMRRVGPRTAFQLRILAANLGVIISTYEARQPMRLTDTEGR